MKVGSFILSFFIFLTPCFAQKSVIADSLCKLCMASTTEPQKVDALNNLANYYYSNKFYEKADSVLSEQLHIAELSNNTALILKTYFESYSSNIFTFSRKENFERSIQFMEHGIEFAKSINNYDYTAIGYARLASILRKRGQYDKALDNANMGLMSFQPVMKDSVKIIVFIELGDCYHAKGQSVQACRSYNNAFDIAVRSKKLIWESEIYRRLAKLYADLNDPSEAKNNLLKSVWLNKQLANGEGLIKDYIQLVKLTNDTFYIKLALHLSDSLHIDQYNLTIKNIMFAIYMTSPNNSKKALDYLNSQADLKDNIMQGGIANYYLTLGEIYHYGNNPDSALYYIKLAEPSILKTYDESNAKYVFMEMAVSYRMKNDKLNAINYYEKTLDFCSGDLSSRSSISKALSELYQETGNFEKAFKYKVISTNIQDSITEMSKNKDIALLDVARETRKHEVELEQEAQLVKNRRNIQYMAITIAILIVFLCMLVIGMFAVSKLAIKILGYFFFISVFEFLVMLLDNTILNSATQGEPLKLWLIKIALIGLLVPFQHFLETRLIKFLGSRELLEVRTKFSLKKWWNKFIKNSSAHSEIAIEEDTAVL